MNTKSDGLPIYLLLPSLQINQLPNFPNPPPPKLLLTKPQRRPPRPSPHSNLLLPRKRQRRLKRRRKLILSASTEPRRAITQVHDDILARTTGVMHDADQAGGLVLDDADAEVLVPHGVDADGGFVQMLEDGGPAGVAEEGGL